MKDKNIKEVRQLKMQINMLKKEQSGGRATEKNLYRPRVWNQNDREDRFGKNRRSFSNLSHATIKSHYSKKSKHRSVSMPKSRN